MLSGNIFQLAYITRNLEKSVEDIRRQADIRTESGWEGETIVRSSAGPEAMKIKVAFIWIGDMQYELIQPLDGSERIYGVSLPTDDSLHFHHTCARVDNWEKFREEVDKQSLPIAFEGGSGPNYFLYLDARKTLGHHLEFAYLPERIWQTMGGR